MVGDSAVASFSLPGTCSALDHGQDCEYNRCANGIDMPFAGACILGNISSHESASWIHLDRIAGGHRRHRNSGRTDPAYVGIANSSSSKE